MSFLFGKEETKNEVPGFVEDAGKYAVERGTQFNQRGFMPYMGPSVAALTPKQRAAMQSTTNARAIFGMEAPGATVGYGGVPLPQGNGPAISWQDQATGNYTPAVMDDSEKSRLVQSQFQKYLGRDPAQGGYDYWMGQDRDHIIDHFQSGIQRDPLTGLPMAGNFGGVAGYSAFPLFSDNKRRLQDTYPGLMDYMRQFSIDPFTGAPEDQFNASRATPNRGGGMPDLGFANDFFDGGGFGRSGDRFQGGGLLSAAGNIAGGPSIFR